MNEWISVNDRFPYDEGDYLCVVKVGDEDVCVVLEFNKYCGIPSFTSSYPMPPYRRVSHWTPLPAPPRPAPPRPAPPRPEPKFKVGDKVYCVSDSISINHKIMDFEISIIEYCEDKENFFYGDRGNWLYSEDRIFLKKQEAVDDIIRRIKEANK